MSLRFVWFRWFGQKVSVEEKVKMTPIEFGGPRIPFCSKKILRVITLGWGLYFFLGKNSQV